MHGNELGRAVALLITLALTTNPADPALEPVRDELRAFFGLFETRSRSAANYHLSDRGRAILELGAQEALEGGPKGLDLKAAYDELRAQLDALTAPTTTELAPDAGNP